MRIWIETMVIFLTVLSFYFVMLACDKKQFLGFFYAGIVFWACSFDQTSRRAHSTFRYLLCKSFVKNVSIRYRFCFLFIFISIAILINIPWLMFYYNKMGTLSYVNQYQHTKDMLSMFPSIQVTVGRPWYYYF